MTLFLSFHRFIAFIKTLFCSFEMYSFNLFGKKLFMLFGSFLVSKKTSFALAKTLLWNLPLYKSICVFLSKFQSLYPRIRLIMKDI